MTIASTRGARSDYPHHGSGRAVVAGLFERRRRRAPRPVAQTLVSKWAVIVYVVVALATPFLIYAGPVVMPPAAPAIADKALHGELYLHRHPMTPKQQP